MASARPREFEQEEEKIEFVFCKLFPLEDLMPAWVESSQGSCVRKGAEIEAGVYSIEEGPKGGRVRIEK